MKEVFMNLDSPKIGMSHFVSEWSDTVSWLLENCLTMMWESHYF